MLRITTAEAIRRLCELTASGQAKDLRLWAGDSLAAAGRSMKVDASTVLLWERADRRSRGRNVEIYYRYLSRLQSARVLAPAGGEATRQP